MCTEALASSQELSFAIDIMRHKQLLKKVSASGAVVEFAPEEFDKAFPHKEKLKLPGQIFTANE